MLMTLVFLSEHTTEATREVAWSRSLGQKGKCLYPCCQEPISLRIFFEAGGQEYLLLFISNRITHERGVRTNGQGRPQVIRKERGEGAEPRFFFFFDR
jgi:hypothetical protein